eukprot:UN00234
MVQAFILISFSVFDEHSESLPGPAAITLTQARSRSERDSGLCRIVL